jgi:tetratricopeptide (TPR) repeat protein
LLALHDAEAWPFCIQLIEHDSEGTITASIIEQLADSDMTHMINILQTASAKNPRTLGVRLNLARAYLAAGDNEKAKSELGIISISDVAWQFQSGFARLRLSADDANFDAKLGEIQDILNAKSQVASEDIEFLEAVIEKETLFSEGYRLLAQSYLSWNEPDDALEVLLDGQKTAPFDPELVALLAKVLWDADESDLAFAYLEQGLNHNHRNATLLSLMGHFLFDNGEDGSAKEYLRQAEAVDPLNPELSATRFYIANALLKGNS